MRVRAVLLAAALVLAPLGARAADLVVWWEEGFNPEEDAGGPRDRRRLRAEDRQAGRARLPLSRTTCQRRSWPRSRRGTRPTSCSATALSGLLSASGPTRAGSSISRMRSAPLASQFDQDALDRATLFDATTGRRGLYALPMGRYTNHVHVWKSLLERAGFTLADIPKEWEAFWSFWCDKVQPAVRKATGRDDIYGVGLADVGRGDRHETEFCAVRARLRGRLRDPRRPAGHRRAGGPGQARQGARRLHRICRKGCTPPASVDWDDRGNNKAFLAQAVVMTPNTTLSIPNALKARRGRRTTTRTRSRSTGRTTPTASRSRSTRVSIEAVVFKDGGHEATAKEFVRFLVGEGWLAHWLDFAGDRYPAADAGAARAAVLARPGRPAPDGRGDAAPDPAARLLGRYARSRAIGGTPRS